MTGQGLHGLRYGDYQVEVLDVHVVCVCVCVCVSQMLYVWLCLCVLKLTHAIPFSGTDNTARGNFKGYGRGSTSCTGSRERERASSCSALSLPKLLWTKGTSLLSEDQAKLMTHR
jgi:hypothetical protein